MKITVGTRGSKLALTQTKWVVSQLKEKHSHIDFEIKVITTTGDRIQSVSLDKIGEKGVFVKEIEEELLRGGIDFAVHSMKDMPGTLHEKLSFSWVPKREDPRDAIILKSKYSSFEELPKGAKIGTGSKRREFQIRNIRRDFKFLPIRGNIDTRLRKLEEEEFDAIVLAMAGLKRLGIYEKLKDRIYPLSPQQVLPSPAQGALAIEIRRGDESIHNILEGIKDIETQIQISAERAYLKTIGGSCHIPIGALCTLKGDEIELEALLGNEDGSKMVKKSIVGKKEEAEELGINLGKTILEEMKS